MTATGGPIFAERFDEGVTDNSPVGAAPGWHAYGLFDGSLTDFTETTPGAYFPSLSQSPGYPGVRGTGYLVLGHGNVVSNVFVWRETGTDLVGQPLREIGFYTKNDLSDSQVRIALQVDEQWFISTRAFQDSGSNSFWVLNILPFSRAAEAWSRFNTNSLAIGPRMTVPLPEGRINGIGVFGQCRGAGKIRIDELQVRITPEIDPDYRVGTWIWSSDISNRQTCRFWKTIEIPQNVSVSRARLRLTADNTYRAFIDGIEFGKGSEWRRLTEYDLTLVLTPGVHVLAIEAFNEWGWAGVVGGLTVELSNRKILEIPTDGTWRIVPIEQKGWTTRSRPREDWANALVLARFKDLAGLPESPQVLFPSALQPRVIRFWQTGWFQIGMLSFCVIVAVICVRLIGKLALQSRAQQVLKLERARIARDIHDDLGAGLTQLVLLGEMAQKELPHDNGTHARFDRISEAGRRLLRSIDEVVWMINSQRDSLQDFETYVCRYAEHFVRLSGLHFRLDVDPEVPQVEFELATRRNLFLATKEALNNAVKHSGASEISLAIRIGNEAIRVTVSDNGHGFDPAAPDKGRNGMINMSRRLSEVGGRCEVQSIPSGGTRIEFIAPLMRKQSGWLWWLRKKPGSINPRKS